MKRFLMMIVVFSTPILIIAIAFEMLLKSIPNDYAFKKKYMDEHSRDLEVLFLGSSHFYYGINPEYISRSSFNAAHHSQSLDLDLAILEKYSKRLDRLKYIVIPISYFSMRSTLESGPENWRVVKYAVYYDINLNKNVWSLFEILNGPLPHKLKISYKYIVNGVSDLNCSKLGSGIWPNDRRDLIETGKSRAVRHTRSLNESQVQIPSNIQTINSMIEFASSHNAKLLFITCPAFSSYRENINEVQLKEVVNIIENVCSNNENAFYLNLFTDKLFNFEDYYDADHLNENGAKKLTLKIDDYINSIANQGNEMR